MPPSSRHQGDLRLRGTCVCEDCTKDAGNSLVHKSAHVWERSEFPDIRQTVSLLFRLLRSEFDAARLLFC